MIIILTRKDELQRDDAPKPTKDLTVFDFQLYENQIALADKIIFVEGYNEAYLTVKELKNRHGSLGELRIPYQSFKDYFGRLVTEELPE